MGLQNQDNTLAVVERTKRWFLRVRQEFEKSQNKFNLEDEFSRTRVNRSPMVMGVVAATAVGMLGLGYLFTLAYDRINNQVRINASEFEDMDNLDLLDRLARLEDEASALRIELDVLVKARERAYGIAAEDLANGLVLLSGQLMDNGERRRRASALEARRLAAQGAADERYGPGITRLGEALAKVEADMAAFDLRQIENARLQALALEGERRVYEMQRDRMVSAYDQRYLEAETAWQAQMEAKEKLVADLQAQFLRTLEVERARLVAFYNPRVVEGEAEWTLLQAETGAYGSDDYTVPVPPAYVSRGILGPQRMGALNRRLEEIRRIVDFVQETPWEGSMPQVWAQLQARSAELTALTASYWDLFWAEIQSQDQTIAARNNQITDLQGQIRSLERTAANQEAALTQLRAEKAALEKDVATLEEAGKALEERFALLSGKYAKAARDAGVDAVVMDANSADTLVAWVAEAAGWTEGQVVYVVRRGTDLMGAWSVTGAGGSLRVLQAAEAMTPEVAALIARIPANRRVPAEYDWVVKAEDYVQSSRFPRAPRAAQ